MKVYEHIISKQIQWAYRNSIIFTGDKGNWGRKAYTENIDYNLFEPLLWEVKSDFKWDIIGYNRDRDRHLFS